MNNENPIIGNRRDNIRVIGVDPGIETTGVAILDVVNDNFMAVLSDCIVTKNNLPLCKRLKEIYFSIDKFIEEYNPSCLAIEDIFFNVNTKTAMLIGAARGVVMLAATNRDIDIYEYTPLQVKNSIVGYGKATKKQIKYMLKMILKVKDSFFPSIDDAWDAMGIAVCHASNQKFYSKINFS